ncbi:uncharacterized protein METZ01_LOCUS197919, partial [marine metagenome]
VGRTLALDFGDKRIGVALSDPSGVLASPLTTVTRTNAHNDFNAISDLVTGHAVETLVVGLPVSLNGTIGPQAQKTLNFCDELRKIISVPIETLNEQYTSAEAELRIRESGGKPSKHRGQVDALAAAIILQEWLDAEQAPTTLDEKTLS